jgi:peptidoglycan/xylan/chitin deacetylase (PgdA/CDA1 family)
MMLDTEHDARDAERHAADEQEGRVTHIYLNFHGLGAPPPHVEERERRYWITPGRFQAVLRFIRDHGCAERVRLTFDDGNRSDVTIALPMLEAFEQRAAFFVVSDRIGTPSYLGAADIARLRDAGMTIGSHGAAHVAWTTLHDAELATQVARSLKTLTGLVGHPVTEVAAPFGEYDRRVLSVLRRLGVTRVYTSDSGVALADTWLMARNTMRMDMPLESIEALVMDGVQPMQRLRQSGSRLARRLRFSPASSNLSHG